MNRATASKENYGKSGNLIQFPSIYQNAEKESDESYSSLGSEVKIAAPKIDDFFSVSETDKNEQKVRIVRTHYSKKIIDALEWLSINHESADESTPYIQPVLENLKIYKERHTEDPFSSFLASLYDSLAFDDSWATLSKECFGELIKIINSLNNVKNIDYEKIDKATRDIEALGLDTTPF